MRRVLLAGALTFALAGCSTLQTVPAAEAPPVNGEAAAATAVAEPVQVSIPKLAVTDEVVPVGLADNEELEVPAVTEVGWYTGLPKPGETGPSLLAGHVNYSGQVGSFARIGELVAGDTAVVTDVNGAAHTFVVYDVVRFPKTEYSDRIAKILADTVGPELRLVTCSGRIVNRSYLDNTVVSLRLAT